MTESALRKAALEYFDLAEAGPPSNSMSLSTRIAWAGRMRAASKALRAALDAPEPAEPQEQVWLSVESAPMSYRGEYPCYVLLWNGHHVGVGFCADSEDDEVSTRYYDESTEIIVPPPTHWMPLPAPPIAAGRASKEKEPAK